MSDLCNGCGACCNPVRITLERLSNILPWMGEPDPFEHPEVYEGASEFERRVIADRIKNANFAMEHWVDFGKVLPISGDQVELTCPFFDGETHRCTNYEGRPPICRGFPFYGMAPEERADKISPHCGYRELAGLTVTFVDPPVRLRKL